MRELLALPIQIPFKRIKDFCEGHDIEKLSLFGPVLTDDFTSQSDVDLLVEFAKGKTPGLAIIDLQDELSQMLEREVDLIPFLFEVALNTLSLNLAQRRKDAKELNLI